MCDGLNQFSPVIYYVNTSLISDILCICLFQIYAMPVFDLVEGILVKRIGLRPSLLLRIITRSTYVGMCNSTYFIGVWFTFFQSSVAYYI